MRILFALLSLVAGLALVFGGFRLARIIIPIWGFLAGLSVGGVVIANMADTPFLGSILGVTVGLFLGLIFALFAYLYYVAAVVVLIGALGYWIGSSFILFFGLNPGLLSTLVGFMIGVLFGIIALLINAPRYVLIIVSSIAGAILTAGGILLLFNQIPLDAFSYTSAKIAINDSALWTLFSVALMAVGIIWQVRNTTDYDFARWSIGDGDSNDYFGTHHMPPTGTHPRGAH